VFAVPVNVKMNNYQKKAREEVLELITVRCGYCNVIVQFDEPDYKPNYCDQCGKKFDFSVTTDSI